LKKGMPAAAAMALMAGLSACAIFFESPGVRVVDVGIHRG
jgi:hypothetical protein